tara:strand:- start:1116 stop:1982 length:867 start_codon:yes stop_codon:yes gene_type:complete
MTNKQNIVLFGIFFILFITPLNAQTIVIPEDQDGWGQTWVLNLNGSQATYNNWSEGGVNTVSGTFSTVYTKLYKKDQLGFGFRTNLRYGQSRIDGDTRKSDDLISIRSRVMYDFQEGGKVAAYGAFHFKTQFAEGYDYGAGLLGEDILISNFMAPGYFTEGVGIEFRADEHLQLEGGFALKQTIVNDDDLIGLYNMTDNFRSEGGLAMGITYQNTIAENIQYSSSLETFTNLLQPVNETDVFWSNEIKGQINSVVSASFQFELRYDDDFSSEVQVKQVLSAGISVNLY